MTVEVPIQPAALMLASVDYDTLEGASILGSLRGSREFATPRDYAHNLNLNLGGTPREAASAWGMEGTEEFMSAPSFFLTSLAAGMPSASTALVGSREAQALHGIIKSTEACDSATELPVFPRRAAAAARGTRGLSASRSQDWGGGGSMMRLSSPSCSDLLLLPPISHSRDDKAKGFLELIDGAQLMACSTAAANAAAAAADHTGANDAQDAARPADKGQEGAEAAAEKHPGHGESQGNGEAAEAGNRRGGDHEGVQDQGVGGIRVRRRPARVPVDDGAAAAADPASGAAAAGDDVDENGAEPKASSKGRKRARKDTSDEGSGMHVRYRPDMQKKARDGQEHWLSQVKRVRAEWLERGEGGRDDRYNEQIETCAAQQIKSQHECILRTLQMARTDGLIEAMPFADCGPDSFLGWTGFSVVPEHAQDFRKRIDLLFPAPLKENTLHTAFRRAGLVPEKWSSGWLGLTAFRYSNDKRVAYAPTPAAAAAATKPKKK